MKMTQVKWRVREALYGPHESEAMLGAFVVGSAGWNRLKRDDPPYEARLRLPGFKDRLGRFETEADAMARVEDAVSHWIARAGLAVAEQTTNEA
jgi:hypothetical protein